MCNLFLQMKVLLHFGVVACVFLFAYGVAMQSLLYPNAEERWWHILYNVFSRPYLNIYEHFELDELTGEYNLPCRNGIIVTILCVLLVVVQNVTV